MSIDDQKVVDSFAFSKDYKTVILAISDHHSWPADPKPHLYLLQEKLNNYIAFVETGQFYKSYPEAVGKRIIFRIYHKYPLHEDAQLMLSRFEDVLDKLDISLEAEYLPVN